MDLTQGFCNSRFGPNSRIFTLTQVKYAVTYLKMVKIGQICPKSSFSSENWQISMEKTEFWAKNTHL